MKSVARLFSIAAPFGISIGVIAAGVIRCSAAEPAWGAVILAGLILAPFAMVHSDAVLTDWRDR